MFHCQKIPRAREKNLCGALLYRTGQDRSAWPAAAARRTSINGFLRPTAKGDLHA
jgi:hypothetical protein